MSWLSRGKVTVGILIGISGALIAFAILPSDAGKTQPAYAASNSPTSGITTTGLGKVYGTPDTLHLQMGVSATKPDVSQALATANDELSKVISTLKSHGVAAKDIQTANLSVNPQYSGGDHPVITGFNVGEDLSVVLRNLKTAGAILSAAISAGGNDVRVNGVSVALDDNEQLLTAARGRAFADAKAKAQQYADLAGRKLGKVVTISEQVNDPQPIGIYSGAASAGVAFADKAVNVEAGQQAVNVNVTIVWDFA